jgi:hypothetical protein
MRARLIVEALCVQMLLIVCANSVRAACLNPPLSIRSIAQFKSNPQALVAPDSDTRTIEAAARDLAGTDASLAAVLVQVAQGTIPRFQTAIAAGLAQAAIACGNVDQQAALAIQQAVASFPEGSFQATFAAVAGDLSTAATAAATASATASVGSVIVVNPNISPGATTPFGGGGTTLPVVFTATAISVTTTTTNDTNGATNTAASTAANTISPTR